MLYLTDWLINSNVPNDYHGLIWFTSSTHLDSVRCGGATHAQTLCVLLVQQAKILSPLHVSVSFIYYQSLLPEFLIHNLVTFYRVLRYICQLQQITSSLHLVWAYSLCFLFCLHTQLNTCTASPDTRLIRSEGFRASWKTMKIKQCLNTMYFWHICSFQRIIKAKQFC
jgi:hypothetical protein